MMSRKIYLTSIQITPLRWTDEGIWFQTGIMLAGMGKDGHMYQSVFRDSNQTTYRLMNQIEW